MLNSVVLEKLVSQMHSVRVSAKFVRIRFRFPGVPQLRDKSKKGSEQKRVRSLYFSSQASNSQTKQADQTSGFLEESPDHLVSCNRKAGQLSAFGAIERQRRRTWPKTSCIRPREPQPSVTNKNSRRNARSARPHLLDHARISEVTSARCLLKSRPRPFLTIANTT